MKPDIWAEIRQPAHEERIWELYHENSKIGDFYKKKLNAVEQEDFTNSIITSLPVSAKYAIELRSNHKTSSQRFTLNELSFLILNSIQERTDKNLISPLEFYLQLDNLTGCDNGLYHYDQNKKELQFLDNRILEIGIDSPGRHSLVRVVIFITAVFDRLIAIYGEIGYRMCLIEVGKSIQRLNESCSNLPIQCIEIEEASERKIEKHLDIDGVNHSVLSSLMLNYEKLQITNEHQKNNS
jgi:SagB-type dehydrogenase family enzyme